MKVVDSDAYYGFSPDSPEEPQRPMHDVDAVILAGGKGTRLRAYTFSIPKPLMPLGERPIIEVLLSQLHAAGVRRVHIALGHLGELLQAHLEQSDRRQPGMEIRYSREDAPLGTAGPLRLIRDLSDTFLLINGDVLTTLSPPALVAHHRRGGALATVAVTRRQLPTRYGVVELSPDAHVVGHREKPALTFDVAMGIYAFSRLVVDRIPPGRAFDVPDLLQSLLAAGEPIVAYESSDYWIDIGSGDDYDAAQRDFAADPERFLPRCGPRAASA